jgi:hypothetical protein
MVSTAVASHDVLGRRRRIQPTSTGKRVTLQERDWLWLQVLHEHGPLPSSFLLAFAKGYGLSEKRAKERLTDLFNEDNTTHGGAYLARPLQQFQTIDSRYNQLVYDLSPAGERALKQEGFWRSANGTTGGPWWHKLMVSCITASIKLAADDAPNLSYIPQADILVRANAELSWPVTIAEAGTRRKLRKELQPDALFGLAYRTEAGSSYRFFAIEADRSTEPYSSKNFNRKSALRNYLQYREYVGNGQYKDHLNLTAPLMVLNVCTDSQRVSGIHKLIDRQGQGANSYMLFQAWVDFGLPSRPPSPNSLLLEGVWSRVGKPDFTINSA